MKLRILSLGLASSLLVACAGNIPVSIKIDPAILAPAPKPPVVSVPPVAPVEPPVVVAPAPEPEPSAPVVLQDLKLHVRDASTNPIGGAFCTVNGERRPSDGGGFIHFPVPGPVDVSCEAAGYASVVRPSLPPGDQNIDLASIAPPAPPAAPPAPVTTAAPASPSGPLCAMRESDPLGCVRQVAAIFPQLLQTNTYASTVEFTQRVLEVLGDPWGHVGKTAGEGQAVPRGFVPMEVSGYRITGVSHDAIKNRVTGQVVDLLGNATANEPCDASTLPAGDECWKPGPANIQWANVPAQFWRASNPFVPAVPVR